MLKIFIISILFITSTNNLFAQTTDWHTSMGGKARFILLKAKNADSYNGVIEVKLNDGWKSFWRNPGSSGMAPTITMQEPDKAKLLYPTPQIYNDKDEWSNIYKGDVFLPVKINSTKQNINGTINIGFCKDMCIPFSFDFLFKREELNITNFTEQAIIENAFANLPKQATNELQNFKIKNKNLILTFVKNSNIVQPAQLFIASDNLEFKQPKIIQTTKNNIVFSIKLLSNLAKKNIIYYNLVQGDSSVSGSFVFN